MSENNDAIEIVTVYSPHEANTYLLDDYLKNPTKAKVLKHLRYDKPPVVRMKDVINPNPATDDSAKDKPSVS